MRIFADSHHQGLTQSLKLLFSKRLHYELRFPAGLEWWNEGFWAVFPHIDTAKQYLERETEGVMGINLDEFKKTKFDILLCSIPQHIPMWLKLRYLYQPQAKLIFQVGNVWDFDESFPIKNILASAIIPNLPGFNTAIYHEEFDLSIFYPQSVDNSKKIYSFINCLNTVDLYKKDWELFIEMEKLMPDWEFRSFGGQCRDGWYNGPKEVADKMREATFIYNCKTNGDGFGFTIHQAAAVGRPLIVRLSDYNDKLAGGLITSKSSILVDNQSPEQIKEQIEAAYKYRVEGMGMEINERFRIMVDFDKEEVLIRDFLEKLL